MASFEQFCINFANEKLQQHFNEVTYQTDTFLDKNRDYVVVEHCNLLASSKCPFVAGLFPSPPEESSRSSYKFSSVATRFKQQLQSLMETLNTTEPHYIRCVKPNSLNRPQKFENLSILHQLRCGLGRTKVFLRAGQIGILDSRRAEVLDTAAKRIQRRLRTFIAHRNFISTRGAAISLQAYCRGCLARKMFAERREAAAAVCLQKYVRRWLFRCAYLKLVSAIVIIQSNIRGFSTRQKFIHGKKQRAATLIQEANEAGALRLAKTKLEKQLEDLTWRLHLEKRMRVSAEEAKSVEISKLQKALESLTLELDAAKLATISECNKNAVLQNQLELSIKEKSALEKDFTVMAEMRKENALLKSSLDTLEKKNSSLELELKKALKDANDTIEKLRELEQKNSELQRNMQSLEEKLSHLEDENHVLRQKALTPSPKTNRTNFAKSFSDESPTPSKIVPLSHGHGMSDSRRSKLTAERQQNGKPLAACIIYKCLHHWHSFESERTAIFDYIIEGINDALKGLKSPFKYLGFEDGMSHIEARYPAILFKQQLTACVEKIFGLIRDNIKKDLAPLLGSCIQVPKNARVLAGKSRSPGGIPQQSPSSQWDSIMEFLDSLMDRLRENYVPSFFIRKLITQVFSFINISLFNSLLLRRECCSFSNGEYVKSGLAELEKWIVNAKEEVVAEMREMLNKDNQHLSSNSFLLDDDLSIPFSTEDIDIAIPAIDPSDVELPAVLSGYSCAQFLIQQQK
ncbi:IQ motif, EF-hand binding site [Corchorus olitorius]|uniref:IQ motif, EF-hand binding site n=1 Tax=Corchorus olitorius TaxID=93759 RepID=A0A1R3IV47_9ROSI|nr:IQ motif, EF-hand binding site [Corchorus olitorius]